MSKSDLRQETSRTADLGWNTHLTQNDTGWGQSTRQIATLSVQSFLHRDQVISRVGTSASCLVTTSTVHGCDRQTDMTMKKTRCSTEVTQRKMNRLINSGKRVDGVDRFSAESSRSTESSKVESIDFQSSWVDSFDSIDFKDCHHNLSYIAKYEHDSCHMHCNSQYERALFRLMKMNHSFFCMSYSAGALFTPAVIRQSWGSKR